jgi:hypothetical protein
MAKEDSRGLSKEDRLDIPGFQHGIKTGDFIDVPRIFGGRPSPKKCGPPHSFSELSTGEIISRARKGLQLATRIAKVDHFKRKRQRGRELKKAVPAKPIRACNRRFFEAMGMDARFIAYVEPPELFISKSKQAYEITDGLLAFVTVTSAREALIIVASLAKFGIAAYFNRIAVPRSSR